MSTQVEDKVIDEKIPYFIGVRAKAFFIGQLTTPKRALANEKDRCQTGSNKRKNSRQKLDRVFGLVTRSQKQSMLDEFLKSVFSRR